MNLFELTKELMSIPSVSGDEEAVGFFLRDHLQSLGWKVEADPSHSRWRVYRFPRSEHKSHCEERGKGGAPRR